MKSLLVGAVVALSLIAPLAEAAKSKAAQSAEEIQQTLTKFDQAWNKHQAKELSALFTEDAVLINPMGKHARGRVEIEQLFAREHGEVMSQSTIHQRLQNVRLLKPDLALIDQEITVTNQKDPSGRMLPEQRYHATMLLTKRGNSWLVLDGRPYRFIEQPQSGVGGAGSEEIGPAPRAEELDKQ